MKCNHKTVDAYLKSLPEDRAQLLNSIRQVILSNLDEGFEEGIQYNMIGYFVPHRIYPAGYHCNPQEPVPFVSMASQKHHIAIYLFCLYADEKEYNRFVESWTNAYNQGKAGKPNMGKSCVRIKTIEDIPLSLIGKTIKRMTLKTFLQQYEAALQ